MKNHFEYFLEKWAFYSFILLSQDFIKNFLSKVKNRKLQKRGVKILFKNNNI